MAQRTLLSKSSDAPGPVKTGRLARKSSGVAQPLMAVQSAMGNQAFSRLLQSGRIQAKLAIGPSDDPLEKEADRVADAVDQPMSISLSHASKGTVMHKVGQVTNNGPMVIQASEYPSGLESTLHSASQGGRPLDSGVQTQMEANLGVDFSAVRIHTGALSGRLNRDLNSLAFTHDTHIHFAEGKYDPLSSSGRRLLAHELAHVVQQGSGVKGGTIQRQKDKSDEASVTYPFQVPKNVKTISELFQRFNLYVFGRDDGQAWEVGNVTLKDEDLPRLLGTRITLRVPRSIVEKHLDPATKKSREDSKKAYEGLKGGLKDSVKVEADRRYSERSGDKPGSKTQKNEEGKAQMREQALADVLKDKDKLASLPPAIKQLMGPETSYKPIDYEHLVRIAEKLTKFTAEDLAAYKLLTIRATDNLDLFEKSVDMFLARREELKKALDQQPPQAAAGSKEPTLKDAIEEKWKGLDESAIGTMSESDRYALARQKTDELTQAQLKYMKDHPGETIKDFAKAATLQNTSETFSAIGRDLEEVANSDANTWARWAAGTGAGAKLSGWLLALAGVIYVASWFTGIGELATIAAAAGVLLGTTLTLSAVESDLRVKAASQAKTPEEFKRNVELAAAAQANVLVAVALIVVAAVLHFTAKALFPETMKKISTSIKNFRERIRLKGAIGDLKPQIRAEMGTLKGELAKRIDGAKQQAAAAADELGKLSTEQFAAKLDKGAPGTIYDQTRLPPEQKLNFGELMKSPEGRSAVEGYRSRLVNALRVDIPAEIDRLGQEYATRIDEFLKDVEAAKNHDDLKAAADKIEGSLTEEHAKKFIEGEQERLTKQKLEEGVQELKKQLDDAAKAAAKLEARRVELAKNLEGAGLAKGKAAEQVAKWAADSGIIDRVESLLDYAKKGLYGNPKQLVKIVEFIGKGAKQHIQALDDALSRLAKGHKVDIEAEADVVDHTDKEAIQHKQVALGKSDSALSDNVKSALKQLAGKGAAAEKPPTGYKRVADIRITQPENPQYRADPVTLQKYLREMKALSDRVGTTPDADPNATLEGLGPDLQLRITNARGTFKFDGPNFDLVK